MKVENMTSSRGNKIANQFIITTDKPREVFFQSYDSVIAKQSTGGKVYLDEYYWDYSVTISKYRNLFLGETTKETQAKIDSGEYILVDLNQISNSLNGLSRVRFPARELTNWRNLE